MLVPSRVNGIHRLRQSTSKSNARYVDNAHAVNYNATADIPSISDVLQSTNNLPVSSKAHGASCDKTPSIVTNAPVAWQDEFPGGSAIESQDYDDAEAQAWIPHQEGCGRSEAGETDAVVSVHDLGFSAARWPTQHSRSRRPSQSDISDHISCRGHSENHTQSATDIEDRIRYEIESNLSWSAMDREEYLPVDAFEKIFNIDNMMSLVRAIYKTTCATEEELIQKASQIWGDDMGSRRRIIATLVFMKQASRIEDFIEEKIFDHHLPLCHESKSRKEFRTLVGGDRTNTTLFRSWERVHVDLFYVYQKMIFVPFLSMEDGILCSYVFDGNVRLPWDKFEQKTAGGHGTIHRLEIHQSHHDYNSHNVRGSYLFYLSALLIILLKTQERPTCFAVKEINGANHESYRNELRALERSCAKVQKEKHLIKLLLTFQHGNTPYLVFEWADGNLEEFWKKRQVKTSPSATNWMAQQCRGIANAIKRIHGLTTWQKEERSLNHNSDEVFVKDWGRHGDIKPTNILWFSTHGEDRDHLVVADLGLTRYHSSLTKSRVMRVDGYTGTYRAPEIDLGNPISAKYDIWSLGCVFLEFCIWFLLGYDDVENFQRDRNLNRSSDDEDDIEEPDHSYFVTSQMPHGGKRAKLHPAVQKWVKKLRNLVPSTSFAHHMLDLIMNGMIVIDPKGRHSIDIISLELSRIESRLPQTSEGLTPFPVTKDKTYPSPEPKSSKNHLQVPGSPASLVRFAEGNCVIPDSIMSSVSRRDRALSIASSDGDSYDGSWNDHSTAATSVFDEELDDYPLRPNATTF